LRIYTQSSEQRADKTAAFGTGPMTFGAAVRLSVVAGPADGPQIGPNDKRKATAPNGTPWWLGSM